MPKAGFEDMWRTIKKGDYWEGLVKNMTSTGAFYVVMVWIKPRFDKDGNIIGYIAGRKIPDKDLAEQTLAKYRLLKEEE
jgi:hypothetical protein